MNNITQMQLNAISTWSTKIEAQLGSTTKTITLLFEAIKDIDNTNKLLAARIEALEGKQNEPT